MLPETLPILGGPLATPRQCAAFLALGGVLPDQEAIIAAYLTFGALTGIGNAVPLAQACHETATFRSHRWTLARNPAGIGATNDGAWGSVFPSVAAGVLAQYAHLLAYARPLGEASYLETRLIGLDPRLTALQGQRFQGRASRWIDLNGHWAVPGPTYAQAILKIAARLLALPQ